MLFSDLCSQQSNFHFELSLVALVDWFEVLQPVLKWKISLGLDPGEILVDIITLNIHFELNIVILEAGFDDGSSIRNQGKSSIKAGKRHDEFVILVLQIAACMSLCSFTYACGGRIPKPALRSGLATDCSLMYEVSAKMDCRG
uniref:Uncharacterized protein n=1 Tax=Ananas comosus var. bracteatus TaxID=296719 RepID=A0A6V7PY48_ANACO|nr:unnamed protein product [Ananas comosus var. bracteatus]